MMEWDIVFAVSTIIAGSCVGVGLANLIGHIFRRIAARRADYKRRMGKL